MSKPSPFSIGYNAGYQEGFAAGQRAAFLEAREWHKQQYVSAEEDAFDCGSNWAHEASAAHFAKRASESSPESGQKEG